MYSNTSLSNLLLISTMGNQSGRLRVKLLLLLLLLLTAIELSLVGSSPYIIMDKTNKNK